MIVSFLFICFLLSLTLTGLFRRYAISKKLLDIPNNRSLHTVAIPRGGGLAIVITFLLSLVGLFLFDFISVNMAVSLIGATLLVAGVGLWDDYHDSSIILRLFVHFMSAFWLLFWLNESQLNHLFYFYYLSDWFLLFLTSFLLVWLLNLYNFMDGIDGIASSEAVFTSAALGVFAYIDGHINISLVAFSLMMSTLGFLIFNWPPAKIFMGDVGSGFLGIAIGGIMLALMSESQLVWPYIVLLGVFLIDATVTLLIRFFRKERWYEAHCSHAYQHAARKWGHAKVTMSINLINLFWLLPCSFVAFFFPDTALFVAFVAFVPLVVAVLMLGAGKAVGDK